MNVWFERKCDLLVVGHGPDVEDDEGDDAGYPHEDQKPGAKLFDRLHCNDKPIER
jgi:hypothetical protein